MKIKGFRNGIHLRLGSGNTVTGIVATKNNCGIWVINTKNNSIINNNADFNTYQGILIQGASSNRVTGNTACDNVFGFYLMGSTGNTLTGNTAGKMVAGSG